MDSNNTQYFLIREADEFSHRSSRFVWDARRKALVLAQDQPLRLPASDPAAALAAWPDSRPLVRDNFAQLARLSQTRTDVEFNAGRGFHTLLDGELRPVTAPAGTYVDLALGGDGRLAAPYSDGASEHGVLVFHLGRRWQTHTGLAQAPLRACVDRANRIWLATASNLLLCEGEPLPHPYAAQPDRFEPLVDNPQPLRVLWQQALAADEQPLALCADAEQIYVLTHDGAGAQRILARSLLPVADAPIRRYPLAQNVPFAVDLGVVAPGRFAALAPREAGDIDFRQRDCPVLQLRWDSSRDSGDALLIGERYPMLSQAEVRFAGGMDGVLRYLAASDVEGIPARPRELHPLQRPHYPTAAQVSLTGVLDAGQPDTLWHRLYLDGCIPPGCRIALFAKAYNHPDQRTSTPFIRQPDLLWTAQGSERPFSAALAKQRKNESGLFELLLQRHDGLVRRLAGRYLQLRMVMESDGRHTPAVHALRVYYPRFSYQEAYLPEYLRQEIQYTPEQAGMRANGADVRERFLAAFEGMLTPLEGRVARSETLLDPAVTPEVHLPWLAEVLGQSPPPHWPAARRRRYVRHTGALQKARGTLTGVQLALDIATDGAVARGQVVLVENFRLRRTMATVLGIDMDDRDHPLTLGTGMSGNSIVGDSLILSDSDTREFLALFSPELATAAEREQVEAFFEQYANRVSVLLHGEARAQRDIVAEILRAQMPAQLQWRILETDHPFVLGLSPLLAVDTYLETQPPPRRVTLDDTYLGREGVLQNPVAFSPRDAARDPTSHTAGPQP